MANGVFSHRHVDEPSCPSCGTPIRHGVTTQYIDDLDTEICAVCEQPLSYGENQLTAESLRR